MSACLEVHFSETGIEFRAAAQDWLRHPESLALKSQSLAAYLAQLEIEGYATQGQAGVSILWEDLYRALNHPDHTSTR